MLFSLYVLCVQRPLTSIFSIIYSCCCSTIWNGRRAPAGPSVLRVKMSLEVYLRAWIVTPFRGIFSIINVLARSRSNQLRILSLRDQLRACLHEGGGPQVGEVTCGRLPHLTCKRDHIKIRDCMDRRVTPPKRVTSPSWGPPPPCKQALRILSLIPFLFILKKNDIFLWYICHRNGL